MTRERLIIRNQRLNDPSSQPEVEALLAAVEEDREKIYRQVWLEDWATQLSRTEEEFRSTTVSSPDWHKKGAVYLHLVAARAEFEALTITRGVRLPSIGVKAHHPEVAVARLAALYLLKGKYYQFMKSHRLPEVSPIWSESEFRALARIMNWGDAAKDIKRTKFKDLPKILEMPEFMQRLPGLSDFRQMLNLVFGSSLTDRGTNPSTHDTKDWQAILATKSLISDLFGLKNILDSATDSPKTYAILCNDELTVRCLRDVLPELLSRLLRLLKTVEPGAEIFQDIGRTSH